MKKQIRIISFSKPHLWYANKIGKVFDVETEFADSFQVENGWNPADRVLKADAEIIQAETIKICGYRGFVHGDNIFTEGSIHRVCEPPKGNAPNGERGYWIKGSQQAAILILHGEYLVEEYKVI